MEEKPFKRITKRLLGQNALITNPPVLPPTPPLDSDAADEEAAAYEKKRQQQLEDRRLWREDVLMDFAAFESSIIRIQFLLTSNSQERERYAAKKVKIQDEAQSVMDNTADLRIQLDEAQKRLALRKEYDELAEKITNNRQLKPRDEQHQNIEKLHAEIAELERESQDYAHTWAERRDQFGKIIDEGMQLRRLIRDEKEEVERREGMEGQGEVDQEHKGVSSGINTPRHDVEANTLMQGIEKEDDGGTTAGGLSGGQNAQRGASPLREVQMASDDSQARPDAKDDEEMAEDGELAAESEIEDGSFSKGRIVDEQREESKLQETMDVT